MSHRREWGKESAEEFMARNRSEAEQARLFMRHTQSTCREHRLAIADDGEVVCLDCTNTKGTDR